MTNDTVKHKLRVFISSKCGGRYEIARKALEKLLNETGLVESYCFETEPGSSESMPSAYLDQIHLYQLFLLIVDNEDKITDATLSEYKKAKELGLRIVGIFCNETSKQKTEVEEEMIKSGLCKFDTATRFSDIVELSYRTVMQDILNVYTKKPTMDDRDIIACMNYLSKSLEKANLKNLPDEITASILQLAISLFSNKERDVRFLGVKCLIELTHTKYQDIALKQLSICMDSGCADIRLAIISRIKKIKDNSSTKQYIIQKAKIDNHYLVREIAKEKETA